MLIIVVFDALEFYLRHISFYIFQNILTMSWKKDQLHRSKQPTASSRKISNHRFSHDNLCNDDDDDDVMGRPIESVIPVEVKVRPEFGPGGALGRLLLLQSCRKKDTSIVNNDEFSTF
jgi:hypothetical protein